MGLRVGLRACILNRDHIAILCELVDTASDPVAIGCHIPPRGRYRTEVSVIYVASGCGCAVTGIRRP
jgi:hypothetical protein